MLPWGHAAFGYLLYSLWRRRETGTTPAGVAVVALAVGTQFPDLIDKPLSWTFALLPTGRSLAHSAFFLALVGFVVLIAAHRYGQATAGRAFLFGYASHLVADALYPVANGDFHDPVYVLWPLVSQAPEEGRSFVAFFLGLDLTSTFAFELLLTGVALLRWWADGAPGLGVLRAGVRRSIVPERK